MHKSIPPSQNKFKRSPTQTVFASRRKAWLSHGKLLGVSPTLIASLQTGFLAVLLLTAFALFLSSNSVLAQEGEPIAPAPVTTTPNEVLTPVQEVEKAADDVIQHVNILDRITAAAGLDDEALVGARVKYQNALSEVNDIIRRIDEQSAAVATRLTDIGPPPEDSSVVEPRTVTETRAQLNADKSRLAVEKNNLENLKLAIQATINRIIKARQDAFTAAISAQTDLSTETFSRGIAGISSLASAISSHFSDWFRFVLQTKFWEMIGSTIVSLAVALFLSFNFNRYFSQILERRSEDPDYFTRVFTAFWATVIPSAATAIFLFVAYTLFFQFEVFNNTTANIILQLFLVISGLMVAWYFCASVLMPWSPQWRLVDTGDRTAGRLFVLIFSLFVIFAVDSLVSTVNSVLSGPLELTVLQGLVASVLIGLVLLLMAYVIHQMRCDRTVAMAGTEDDVETATDGKSDTFRHQMLLLLVAALAVGGSVLIISALLGYIGFARFLSRQLIVTGSIMAIMYLGFLAARELAREGVLARTGFGKRLVTRGMQPYRIEQASLLAGGLLILGILMVGIPAILMQWGTRLEEITAFASRAFFGIDVGNIRISLSGLLIGLAIFGIVIVLTRIFQRWLGRSIFPRSNLDPGVSDSIKAGIGYTGFALAALLAITSAGLDLSSLAIVAGALSLGIGFGLQNVVSNFVSGLILLVERPIKVGDWIIVGAAEGTVKRISVRATEIETFQRQSIIVPNSELINSQVSNWTFKSKHGRVDVDVGIAYGSDARLAERILYEIASTHAMVQKKPEPNVWFVNFGPSSLDLRLRMYVYDIGNIVTVETEVRFAILERFAEAGVEIPFPQQDVHIKLPRGVPPLEEQIARASAPAARKPARRRKPSPG